MKQSAGILLYRNSGTETEFFLVHPGGPYFAKKNEGWWTIPKGELLADELPLDCAIREFQEETGYTPLGPFKAMEPIVQKGGKKVYCWSCKGDLDADTILCNTFEIEWPPKSGKKKEFHEVDKAGWFTFEEAKVFINERQISLLEELNVQISS